LRIDSEWIAKEAQFCRVAFESGYLQIKSEKNIGVFVRGSYKALRNALK
jgi:hypothetical protein